MLSQVFKQYLHSTNLGNAMLNLRKQAFQLGGVSTVIIKFHIELEMDITPN